MNTCARIVLTGIALAGTLGLVSAAPSQSPGHSSTQPLSGSGQIGPDIVAWNIAGGVSYQDINYYGSADLNGDGVLHGGYSMATISCNWGDIAALWNGGTNQTPLIGQNAYRLNQGRFEQIGVSWLKHSFCALSESGCGDCQSTNCDTLGIGCADTYGAGLNQGGSGPRSVVNAYTGEYPYPFGLSNSGPGATRGNLVIADADVEPSQNSGARYFFEGQYVCPDEAAWGNQFNNASWREVTFSSVGSASHISATNVEPAIRVWKQINPNVVETDVMVPNDGLLICSALVTDLGNGMYRYEYALYNQNCHRSVGVFSVPIPQNATIENVGFHDVDYHSGEVLEGTDWAVGWTDPNTHILWATQTYGENQNANAIRWGSMYNFRFDVNAEPVEGQLELGLFRPGGDPQVFVSTVIPAGTFIDPCEQPLGDCPTDINGDYVVSVNDLLAVISEWGTCGDGTFRPASDVDDDCCVTVNDLLLVISDWGMICAPTGACCLPDGSCQELSAVECQDADGSWNGQDTSCSWTNCPQPGACCLDMENCQDTLEADCDLLGGIFRGQGTDCASTDCSQSEYNDDCEDAWFATDGIIEFSTVSATTDGDTHSQCKWGGQTYNDIWFHYTASCSGTLVLSTCDTVNYDSDLVCYEGWDCNDLTFLGCNDDGSGCGGYSSYLEVPVVAGEPYTIRVGGWESGDSGSGTLLIECGGGD